MDRPSLIITPNPPEADTPALPPTPVVPCTDCQVQGDIALAKSTERKTRKGREDAAPEPQPEDAS